MMQKVSGIFQFVESQVRDDLLFKGISIVQISLNNADEIEVKRLDPDEVKLKAKRT